MRLILTILLIGLFKADAQMVINASAPYRRLDPFGCGDTTRLLDSYTGAEVAYSLRKLRAGYTGSCIRVRKDTTGQPEQDFGFDICGFVDTNAIKGFINQRGAFLVTWYDQSLNGRNATQSVQASQPRIAEIGGTFLYLNNKISVGFSGAGGGGFLTHSVIATSPTRLYIFSSLSSEAQSTIWWSHRSESTRLIQFQHAASSNEVVLNLRSNTSALQTIAKGTFTASRTNNILASARFDVANNTHISYLNNSASTTNTTNFSGQTFNSTRNAIGAVTLDGTAYSSRMTGRMHELVIYSSDQSSNLSGIHSNINNYFSIY